MVSLLHSCSIVLSIFWLGLSLSLTFTLWSAGTAKSSNKQFLFFFWIKTKSGLLAWIGWSVCISKFQCISCLIFQHRFIFCAYTCQWGQILVTCIKFLWSLSPPIRICSFTLSVSVCCIRLSYWLYYISPPLSHSLCLCPYYLNLVFSYVLIILDF